MITIENVSGRIQVFNLTNAVAPLRRIYQHLDVDKDGNASTRERRVVHPDSLTIPTGQTVEVPDSYQSVPSIRKALARFQIRIAVSAPAEAAVLEAAPEPVSEDAAGATEESTSATTRRRR
jgi:hypothetical protein